MIYAYARVSTRDQNLDRQLNVFASLNIDQRNIFCDKKSGKDFERIQYSRLLRKLKSGDLLVIKSIAWPGRNYDMIIEEWSRITGKIGADILVIDMPLLDTRSKPDSLVGKFISDIVLQILSFVAENEREVMRIRQAEGIRAAKLKGIRFGRPPLDYTEDFLAAAKLYHNRSITLKNAFTAASMTCSSFCYHYYKLRDSGALADNSSSKALN